MVSIPHLFVEHEQVISTEEWHANLLENPKEYDQCYVMSITHVKNLNSTVSHEYLQVIIEDGRTAFRTRLICERQSHQDQIIIGRWVASQWPSSRVSTLALSSSVNSSSSSGQSASSHRFEDLPLPLASLKFDGVPKLGVCDLAKILYQTTRRYPKYTFFHANCYWFARNVYGIVQTWRPRAQAPYEKLWSNSWLRGKLVVLKPKYQGNARDFEKQREDSMEYLPPSQVIRQDSVIHCVEAELLSGELQDWIEDEWAFNIAPPPMDFEVDLSEAKAKLDRSVDEFCAAELKDEVTTKRNVATYDEASSMISDLPLIEMPGDRISTDIELVGPTAEQTSRLNQAMKSFIGGILTELQGEIQPSPTMGEIGPCALLPAMEPASTTTEEPPESLAVAYQWKWDAGSTLRVRFLNGEKPIKEEVKKHATEWTKYANIKFEFVEDGDADIRILFKEKQGSMTYLGTKSRKYNQNEPTMLFGGFNQLKPGGRFAKTVLHEFGHALGCIHEHQSPAGGIKWNKQAVYDYYNKNHSWSYLKIDHNILSRYRETDVRYSAFDKDSIMMYEIYPWLTEDSQSIEATNSLSKRDQHFIAALYPRDTTIQPDDPNALDQNLGFPLYWAAAGGHYDEVAKLLKRGANPNKQTAFLWTALHWAAGNGFIDVVRLLLEYGAKVNIQSDTRKTPLDMAKDERIIQVLKTAADEQYRGDGNGHMLRDT